MVNKDLSGQNAKQWHGTSSPSKMIPTYASPLTLFGWTFLRSQLCTGHHTLQWHTIQCGENASQVTHFFEPYLILYILSQLAGQLTGQSGQSTGQLGQSGQSTARSTGQLGQSGQSGQSQAEEL